MIKYEVGKQFPGINPMPGHDFTIADFSAGFFDIKCYATDPTAEEVKIWRKGSLKYGLYVNSDIPFFIVQLPGWSLDININILKIKTEEQREQWLNTEGNVINLFLINSRNNTLSAMRMIGIQTDISEAVRDTLEKQIDTYGNHEEVELKIAGIQHVLTTADMINRTKMISL